MAIIPQRVQDVARQECLRIEPSWDRELKYGLAPMVSRRRCEWSNRDNINTAYNKENQLQISAYENLLRAFAEDKWYLYSKTNMIDVLMLL